MSSLIFKGMSGQGKHTETAGTAIVDTVGGVKGHHTYLTKAAYTAGATAHTLTVMRAASHATVTSAAAASQAVVNVSVALTDGGGNAAAANDYVVVRQTDGSWHTSTVASVASLAYTLNDNFGVGAAVGADVFCYGVVGDTYHSARHTFALASGGQTVLPSGDALTVLVRGKFQGAPLITSVNNATNAGTMDYLGWGWKK